jgi:hypothetical protein
MKMSQGTIISEIVSSVVLRLICKRQIGTNYKELKDRIMENEKYESPSVEVINVVVDQPILTSSFTGEDINEWEDMY